MTIRIKETQEAEVEVTIPFFRRTKDGSKVRAVLDEKTFIQISKFDDYACIVNCNPSLYQSEINEAWKEYFAMTETEFFDLFQEAVESISLHPILTA